MIIQSVKLHNFKCFYGQQEVVLEPKLYGIFAMHKEDVQRSNWLGKSSFMEAIYFCLYGEHKARLEDEWISRGEDKGGVTLKFSDGTEVTRQRTIGQSTRFSYKKGDMIITGEQAQQTLEMVIGLAKNDFMTTCYFEQKNMAQFVYMKPSELMDVMVSWIGLEKLFALEEVVKADYEAIRQKRTEFMLKCLPEDEKNKIQVEIQRLALERQQLQLKIDEYEKKIRVYKSIESSIVNNRLIVDKEKEYEEVVVQGKALRKKVEECELPSVEEKKALIVEYENLWSQKEVLSERRNKLEVMQRKGFDGLCPVTGQMCGIKDQVEISVRENSDFFLSIEKELSEIHAKYKEVYANVDKINKREEETQRYTYELENLRNKARNLQEFLKLNKKEHVENVDIQYIFQELKILMERAGQVYNDLNELTQKMESQEGNSEKLQGLVNELEIVREAYEIVGKKGAQKDILHSVANDICIIANTLLKEMNVDFEIQFHVSVESKDLVLECFSCGNKFSTQREKVCPRCSEQRAHKLIPKLHFSLSNRSGAADDIAGIVFQLSASQWLRIQKHVDWSVVMIDEPFGALDATNRGFVAKCLGSLIHRAFFEQGFIIAHHTALLDALPGRIEIISDGKRAALQVVS
jgi:rRNA maturation endonuclease Nob1